MRRNVCLCLSMLYVYLMLLTVAHCNIVLENVEPFLPIPAIGTPQNYVTVLIYLVK